MLKLSLFDPLKKWKFNGKLGYCVAADVGASGMRLRFSNPENITDYFDLPHEKANCAQDLYNNLAIIEKFVEKSSPKSKCFGSAFAIPGIRKGTEVTPYNWPEPNSRRTIKTELFPQRVFPSGHKVILNDLESGAYGLYQMSKVGNPGKYFRKLWGGEGPVIGRNRTAVMALGSGLGTAILAKDPIYNQPIVISTELGYLQAAAVLKNHEKYNEENKLVQHTSKYYYNNEQMPCYEDFASARGICTTYQMFSKNDDIPASRIAYLAQKGEKEAYYALKSHYLFFTRLAKNVAISLKCDSIVMALSNQVSNDWHIKQITKDMSDEFHDCTRPQWIKDVRVFSQIKEMNFNLLGASYMAHRAITK